MQTRAARFLPDELKTKISLITIGVRWFLRSTWCFSLTTISNARYGERAVLDVTQRLPQSWSTMCVKIRIICPLVRCLIAAFFFYWNSWGQGTPVFKILITSWKDWYGWPSRRDSSQVRPWLMPLGTSFWLGWYRSFVCCYHHGLVIYPENPVLRGYNCHIGKDVLELDDRSIK